jgi:3-deoxy-D-manno-octulosonic-acid transferase
MNGLGLYQVVTTFFEPLARLILKVRVKRGKEDPARLDERLGRSAIPRPTGPLVWLHGASVGESLSLLPLIDRIRAERPDITILVTSGTVTSQALLAKRLPAGVIHQFAPVDGPRAVRRFLDYWRPSTGLFAESELWPNLLTEAQSRGVKLALISARITQRSADGWTKRPEAAKALLSAFQLILPQDTSSANRLAALGAVTGPLVNLKYVADPLPGDEAEALRLRQMIGTRSVVVAASTHEGEEEIIAKACPPDALLIMAIRHPDRGALVAEQLRGLPRQVARRGAGEPLTAETDIYVADTLGEMGLWYRLADVVVMGGSFVSGIGGHNPLEPARLDAAVISGQYVFNFLDIYGELENQFGVTLTDAEGLGKGINDLLNDPVQRERQANAARWVVDAQGAAFEAGWSLIAELLP